MTLIRQYLSGLNSKLVDELLSVSTVKTFPKGTEILKEAQYVKVVPIVVRGLVKVFSTFDEKELLLYYIEPAQSCVMSFYAALSQVPSRVFAVTEEESEILLIPVEKLPAWLKEYPDLNRLFYGQYDLRYAELLETIEHLLVNKMDKRLFDYLCHKAKLTDFKPITLSHGEIANELGTAREVVSRMIKKLVIEGKISQTRKGIEII